MASLNDLRAKIREVPDFPQLGLTFQDLALLFADPDCFRTAVSLLADWARPRRPEIVLGAEARGFILGGALAYELGAGFVAARRPGRLPSETVIAEWELEGNVGSLELPIDAITRGTRVLVHDDLLATGATAQAKVELAEQLGGDVVGIAFVVELELLNGRRRLAGRDIHTLIQL
ncbi:MAG: adenine phosphoribosyltransferase [Gaiellaceae bacterium]|jgi:adenine phosphoribosyltransferase